MKPRRRMLWLFAFLILATLSSSAATGEPVCPASMEEQRKMPRQITTEIEIAAPAKIVWDILLEFERDPEWNPFVREISGEPIPDGRLTIVVQPPGGSAMTFKPRLHANCVGSGSCSCRGSSTGSTRSCWIRSARIEFV